MQPARHVAILLVLVLSLAALACNALAPTGAAPPIEATTRAAPSAQPTAAASVATSAPPSVEPSAPPSAETVTASPTAVPVASPTATTAPLRLEVLQSQTWADRDGNVRVNFLLHNPYEFPVAPSYRAHASLRNSAGELIRDRELYFLDGISGGGGFILPGETIAANACFTCEAAPLTDDWASVEFLAGLVDATGSRDYFTEVKASVGGVAFEGDRPLFDVSGSVTNNSDTALDRISVRVFVYDQAGTLVGAAEASAWDVAPGAAASFNGYGIGQAPDGPTTYEVTALGVVY
jgi:hypothetical protein